MESAFEWIKGIGSLVGLATGVFTVWDRMISSRPRVSFDHDVTPGWIRPKLCLRIENPSKHEIIIEEINYDRDRVQHFFKSDVLEAVHIGIDYPRKAFIKPGEVRLVSLQVPDDFLSDEAELGLNATIRWRRHGSKLLQGMTLKISTTNELLRAMQRDRTPPDN